MVLWYPPTLSLNVIFPTPMQLDSSLYKKPYVSKNIKKATAFILSDSSLIVVFCVITNVSVILNSFFLLLLFYFWNKTPKFQFHFVSL